MNLAQGQVFGALFTENLTVLKPFPASSEGLRRENMRLIAKLMNKLATQRGITEIINANSKSYSGIVNGNYLFLFGDKHADYTLITDIVKEIKGDA